MHPRPSPDQGAAASPADLLGAARKLLPPEVRVVGLAGGLLAGAVALTGCGPSADEVRAAAADSKAHVLGVSRDVLAPVTAEGSYPEPPRGSWAGCDDIGGKVRYQLSARLDPAGDTGRLVDVVRARLSASGLPLRADGPADADVLTLRGTRDDVRVRVTGYLSEPVVLFDLFGPCLEVGDLDAELTTEPPEQLDLG